MNELTMLKSVLQVQRGTATILLFSQQGTIFWEVGDKEKMREHQAMFAVHRMENHKHLRDTIY
jgi:alpha-tubulin suppressor-like RCC1 family protein